MGAWLYKKRVVSVGIKSFENCYNRVCVDYNFLNWYRAIKSTEPKGKIWVIPNFTSSIASLEQMINREQPFESYRGVYIIAEVAKEILRRYDQARFTFAGEGPEEGWLRNQFADESRVEFIKYLPSKALDIHLVHDIAVIPSIASEGTPFSVAEAMGAGCAVVATAIGGIANMIINGYNGVLVMPEAQALLTGITSVLDNPALRMELGRRAHETAKRAFSLDTWKEKWREVLEEVARG
jgi:glycosyltransferase involved in cell wall biosynthesis